MSRERRVLGKIEDGRFTPIGDVALQQADALQGSSEDSDAYIASAHVRDRYAERNVVDEQLETIELVLTALETDKLSMRQIDRIAEIGGRFVEVWRDALRLRARS